MYVCLSVCLIHLTLTNLKKKSDLKFLNVPINLNNNNYSLDQFQFPQPTYSFPLIPSIPNLHFTSSNKLSANQLSNVSIFTDGSRMDQGTAFAFTVNVNNIFILDKIFLLRPQNSIFQAELLALKEATSWLATSHHEHGTIYSDSQASLLTLCQPITKNTIAYQIRKTILDSPDKTFTFSWVKAHANNIGNERADSLAKSPLIDQNTISTPIIFPFPPSYLNNLLRSDLLAEWKELWHEDPRGLYTFNFFQSPDLSLKTQDQVAFYFLTGHGSFPSYLYKIHKKSTDLCECGEKGLPLHYIFDNCPLMPNSLNRNHSLTEYQNFPFLITLKPQLKKIRENYNKLNEKYSFILYKF